MSDQTSPLIIRRILVALDGSPHSLAALEAAANLAHLLDAELLGIFIEDINLLRLAQLPFAREIRTHTAHPQRINISQMRRQLRLQATAAQAALDRIAEQYALHTSFRVLRGPVSAQLLAAALEADLLALGRISRSAPRLGSTAKTAVSQSPRTILLMRPDVAPERPPLVIYDGSEGAARALAIAAALAEINGRLHIILWAEDDQTAQQYQQAIRQQLHHHNLQLQFRYLHSPHHENLISLLYTIGPGLLVLSDAQSTLPTPRIHALLEELDYPILLVR